MIHGIYYYHVSEEERERVSAQLKEHESTQARDGI